MRSLHTHKVLIIDRISTYNWTAEKQQEQGVEITKMNTTVPNKTKKTVGSGEERWRGRCPLGIEEELLTNSHSLLFLFSFHELLLLLMMKRNNNNMQLMRGKSPAPPPS